MLLLETHTDAIASESSFIANRNASAVRFEIPDSESVFNLALTLSEVILHDAPEERIA